MNKTTQDMKHNSNMKQRLTRGALLALLLAAALPAAKAQTTYVFYNSTYGYLYNDNGTLKAGDLRFDNSSVWTASGTIGGTSRTIRSYVGTNPYLGQNGSLSNNSSNWRGSNNYLCYRPGNTNYYLKASNATTFTTNSTQNNGERFSYYTVTISGVADPVMTDFTINTGSATITTSGNYNYGHTNCSYTPAYTNYYFSNTNHYVGVNNNTLANVNPTTVSSGYTWSLSSNAAGYATMVGNELRVTAIPDYDVVITLTSTVTYEGITKTATKEITLQGAYPPAPIISVSGNTVTLSTNAAGTTSIRYTLTGTDPTATTGTVYGGSAFDLSNHSTSPVTIKAVTVRGGVASSVSEEVVTLTVPAPTITVNGEAGTATISAIAGATIYYTTDGSTPTTSSTQYTTGLSGLAMMTTIKAIAVKSGWNNSAVASATVTIPSGVSGGVVTLFDCEPHNWSYYSDASLPEQLRSLNPADVKITYYGDGIVMTGNADYTASSTDFVKPGQTNYTGGAKVNVGGEDENTFVYYKTLERTDGSTSANPTGRCPYTPIYNPFQVRPTYGTRGSTDANDFTGWRGFQCWRLKSVSGGAVYSAASGGTALSTGAVINAETEIYFAPTAEYGMEVELEAVWARAYLVKGNQSGANNILSQNVGVERNFMTLTSGQNYRFDGTSGRYIGNKGYAVTISNYYPSGEAPDNTSSTISGYNDMTLGADTKFENVTFNSMGSYTLTAANHSLIIGRGVTGTVNYVRGASGNVTGLNYTLRLESGTYNYISLIKGYMTGSSAYTDNGSTMSGNLDLRCTLGCDYDRATNSGITNNLTVTNNIIVGYSNTVNNANKQRETTNLTIKSGKIGTSVNINANDSYIADAYQSIYVSVAGSHTYIGRRCIKIEGGELIGIAGGIDAYYLGSGTSGNDVTGISRIDQPSVELRMTGGHVRGAIYGGAAKSPGSGNRRMIFTGGTINGWIGCGCNGTDDAGGKTYGESFLYFGGTSRCEADPDHDYTMNGAKGGYVFGAGKGYPSANGTSGEMTYGTNLAIADLSYIQRDAFGGGNYGYALEATGVYVLGGTVGGNVFGGSNLKPGPTITINTKGNGLIHGGLFGGSNENGNVTSVTMNIAGSTMEGGVYGGGYGPGSYSCDVSGNVDITMTGGTVLTGLYGGGNVRSVITGTTAVKVNGGTVGASNARADVYGGGLGQNTRANNSVTVTIGAQNASSGATIWGDVYGGSAKGVTNYTGSAAQGSTAVTLNAGTVNGSVYGGGYGPGGENADVYGAVTVTVNGGSVKLVNDNPSSIFGCNNVSGTPKSTVSVTVNSTDATTLDGSGNKVYAINGVYGGGNQAHYNPTTVTAGYPSVHIVGCSASIKDVYGGGNAAAVPLTNVLIDGGDIYRVFGGGNGESGTPAHVGYRNKVVGSTADAYTGTADGLGNTKVVIHGGEIYQVFGGSNSTGTIKGTLNVSAVKSGTCAIAVHSLFSGGNKAASNLGSISIGCMEEGDMIDTVFCGANQADITGNVNFTMTGGRIGNLFGGNNQSGNVSGSITLTVNWDGSCSKNYLGNVFGGGNLATFGTDGSPKAPTVNIYNGTVSGNVYGGGKGDPNNHNKGKVTGNPIVNIGDANNDHTAIIEGDVYGGGDAGNVAGTPVVTVANKCNTSIGNVYGGGNAADVSATDVRINGGTVTGDVYGGGHGDKASLNNPPAVTGHTDKVANVNGNTKVVITGATIGRVFAGSNLNGTITGTACTLSIDKSASAACDMKIREVYGGGNMAAGNATAISIGCTGALVEGASGHAANPTQIGTTLEGIGYVYGGANQADIGTSSNNSNITVNINSGIVGNVFGGNNTDGDIYGTITVNIEKTSESNTCGWYVGNVFGGGNQAAYTGSPEVNILNGTVSLNVYGGGKGDPSNHTKGQVTGNPVVTIGDANNLNDNNVVASILGDVYGGGDAGNVVGTPVVNIINKCNTTISGDVYGGGNAADVTGTDVNIDGGTITGMVFGGGHGDLTTVPQKEANVGNSGVSVAITGGTIAKVFGGSNSKGNITGPVAVSIDKVNTSCDLHIDEVYGGGNLAAGNAGEITIGCTGTGNSEGIGDVYGGARQADVNSDITLNITGGKINRVFGGNNISGAIDGDITVNIEWSGSCTNNYLEYVYGGGNQAAYEQKTDNHPEVNILNGTVEHNVFGGGLGATAEVTGNPKVTIGDLSSGHESYVAWVKGDVYGGGDAAAVTGSTQVNVLAKSNNRIDGDVYGGGNAANVSAGTDVNIGGGTIGRVFGGGHGDNDAMHTVAANVAGGTDVNIAGGTISQVFAGSNLNGNITGTMVLEVNKTGTIPMKIGEVYGGGNEAASNACAISIGCTGALVEGASGHAANPTQIGTTLEGIGDVYGGANNALVTGNITLNIESGMIYRVFGGNNTGNTVNGNITVNIAKGSSTCGWYIGYVYGGGNNAPYTNAGLYPAVNVTAGTVTYNVYGGGKGSGAKVTGNPQVTLSGNVHVGGSVFGGGDAAEVKGNTNVLLKN